MEIVKDASEVLPFGHALEVLKNHEAGTAYMQSLNWGGGVKIFIQTPDEHSKMTEPYFYLQTKTDQEGVERRGPFEFSSDLLLADDWLISEVQ